MNFKTLKVSVFAVVLAAVLWPGCSVKVETSTTTDSTATSGAAPAAAPAENGIAAGRYCYYYKDEALTLKAELDYDGASKVSGILWGDIQDQANSYFTSYTTTFEGVRNGGNLDVTTSTEIEGDTQEEKASWPWDGNTLTEGKHKMDKGECELQD